MLHSPSDVLVLALWLRQKAPAVSSFMSDYSNGVLQEESRYYQQ